MDQCNFFYTIFPLFGPQGVNACLLKDQHMQNQMVRPCHNVSRMEQRSERLMPLRRNNPCPCPQCCPRWSPWLWQSAPTKTSSSGTLEAVAPVTATCTARLAGCCPTDTRWVWNTTAATPVTQTKVLTWIGHSWKMTYGLMCAFSRLSPNARFSVQRGVLERLPAWFSGQSVQSVHGRHLGGCDQTLRWQPQWAVLWQHGSFTVCVHSDSLHMRHAAIISGAVTDSPYNNSLRNQKK